MRGAGSGRKQEHSPEDEGFQNSSRRPSDAEDEESVSTMMSETPPQLSHREPGDMLEVYADGDFEDGEEEEEEEEEDALELVVETLTGDSYRVRVSQWDTAASLKDLLYRTQGIHPSHQHLILRDRELVDDACLIDQQVVDGSTLRLVLAIRGGPINARRLPTHEDLLLRDITDHFENASPRGGGGQTFTFLVFHDDENMNVNVYRVMENPDGSYSPLNESFSGANGRGGAEEASVLKTQLTEEEKRTMARMADLRTEMDKLRLRNKKKKDKRKAMVSSTHTSLNSSLRSVTGRLEEALTPRLDLTDIAGGGAAHTTPRKRSAVKRLAGVRRGSRPTTQERLEIMKSSHGRPTLRELPTANPPVPVDFSRRKPLEAIRPQLIGGRLEAVEEMLGRGESSPEQGGAIPELRRAGSRRRGPTGTPPTPRCTCCPRWCPQANTSAGTRTASTTPITRSCCVPCATRRAAAPRPRPRCWSGGLAPCLTRWGSASYCAAQMTVYGSCAPSWSHPAATHGTPSGRTVPQRAPPCRPSACPTASPGSALRLAPTGAILCPCPWRHSAPAGPRRPPPDRALLSPRVRGNSGTL
ncbi:uncharacterized protein LOC135111490 [Scylla paramamosain]|uniref:uncharacterized protein LOC135111490 n=1 Tax=Scylla paramamosain TaxID=85552 RepID=UPI003083E496